MSDPRFKNIGCLCDRVVEECAELIKAIMKATRFGIDNFHPDSPERTNRMDILDEMKDVEESIHEYRCQITKTALPDQLPWAELLAVAREIQKKCFDCGGCGTDCAGGEYEKPCHGCGKLKEILNRFP